MWRPSFPIQYVDVCRCCRRQGNVAIVLSALSDLSVSRHFHHLPVSCFMTVTNAVTIKLLFTMDMTKLCTLIKHAKLFRDDVRGALL
jgi:glucan phosphorylase